MSSQFQPEQSTVVSKQDGRVFDVALKSLLRYKQEDNKDCCCQGARLLLSVLQLVIRQAVASMY